MEAIENAFAEDRVRSSEVEFFHTVEAAIAKKDAKRNLGVRVWHQQIAEALRHDGHRRLGRRGPGKTATQFSRKMSRVTPYAAGQSFQRSERSK